MSYQDRWLLPAGIIESLPVEAAHLETIRRQLIDLYTRWGYQLIIPPMIEFLESLLVGAGKALELQTFKITDPFTGRLMGIRADMTPQMARIDAHSFKRDVPTRLCYLGTVLHTRPNNFAGSRSPLQVGAELFGYQGIAADVEILSLMVETLRQTNILEFHLDIGHLAFFRELAAKAKQEAYAKIQNSSDNEELLAFEDSLEQAIRRKANAEIEELLSRWQISAPLSAMINELPQLHGDSQVLQEARQLFAHISPTILSAIDELEQLNTHWQTQWNDITLHFDLAELRGYNYHTGVSFAAYVPKHGQAVAKGGRYDIGKEFGCSRPATGFSANLRTLISLTSPPTKSHQTAIFAPAPNSSTQTVALTTMIKQLRQAGETVICELPGQPGDAQAMGCDRELRWKDNRWQIISFNETVQ
jgi:ATP phosphoribosyltransferase regulatory subunit